MCIVTTFYNIIYYMQIWFMCKITIQLVESIHIIMIVMIIIQCSVYYNLYNQNKYKFMIVPEND